MKDEKLIEVLNRVPLDTLQKVVARREKAAFTTKGFKPDPQVDPIVKATAKVFGCTAEDIYSLCTTRRSNLARCAAVYIAHYRLKWDNVRMGKAFQRDKSGISRLVIRADDEMRHNSAFQQQLITARNISL
jgi:chromosomal replication initiation ATPase DnaA